MTADSCNQCYNNHPDMCMLAAHCQNVCSRLTLMADAVTQWTTKVFTVFCDDEFCIWGCGGYADNRSGASSTTGHGEGFMKTCLAKHIAVLMEQGRLLLLCADVISVIFIIIFIILHLQHLLLNVFLVCSFVNWLIYLFIYLFQFSIMYFISGV